MDDQYWAISSAQVKQAFEWGLSRLSNARHGHGPFDFSISALHKHLDRIGHATDHTFHIITESEVRSFLHWDLDHNTFLMVAHLILEQSEYGVAIGGFLSSWEAEIWCMWKESIALHQQRTHATQQWHEIYHRHAEPDDTPRYTHTPNLTLIQPGAYAQMPSNPRVAELDHMKRR